jgi:hypothetical protein
MTTTAYIRVKPGILDEELGYDMGGWTGRIVRREDDMIVIEWDGPTLCQIPDRTIRNCIDNGGGCNEYWLFPKDVTDIDPTDTPAQTAQVLRELEERYYDYDMYQLPSFSFATHLNFKTSDALPRNNKDWFAYLQKSLVFPIAARYEEGHFLNYQAEVSLQPRRSDRPVRYFYHRPPARWRSFQRPACRFCRN